MPFFTTAAIIGSAVAGIGGSIMQSGAAKHAADTQAQAAEYAAKLQKEAADNALAFQKQQYGDTQKMEAPWVAAGQGAVTKLSDMVQNGGFPSWNENFQAPTSVTEQNDPGFQFRLQEGQKALERSAASRGGLLSGGTAKALDQYSQDYASNEYGNVYNRAYNDYATRYNQFEQDQSNTYNRYAGLAGLGQTSAQTLATAGTNSANNMSSILLGSSSTIGNYLQNAAYQRASGYGAYGSVFNSIGSNTLNLAQLLGKQGGGSNQYLDYDPTPAGQDQYS